MLYGTLIAIHAAQNDRIAAHPQREPCSSIRAKETGPHIGHIKGHIGRRLRTHMDSFMLLHRFDLQRVGLRRIVVHHVGWFAIIKSVIVDRDQQAIFGQALHVFRKAWPAAQDRSRLIAIFVLHRGKQYLFHEVLSAIRTDKKTRTAPHTV